jgi:hypothetical protein
LIIYINSYSAAKGIAKGLATKREPIIVDGKETTTLKQAGMINSNRSLIINVLFLIKVGKPWRQGANQLQ